VEGVVAVRALGKEFFTVGRIWGLRGRGLPAGAEVQLEEEEEKKKQRMISKDIG